MAFKNLSGCNIGSKTLLAERGKLPLKLSFHAGTSTYPATLLNKDELHCEDSALKITCRAWQVRVLFCLHNSLFLLNTLAMRQVVMLHAVFVSLCFGQKYPQNWKG